MTTKTDTCKKGAIQIDYIISLGLFLVVFAFIVFGTSSYFVNIKDTIDVVSLRTEAFTLLRLSDSDFTPAGWNGTSNISRIGLSTTVKRFRVYVNNSKPFYINQSLNVTNLDGTEQGSEIVRLNLSQLGFQGHDFNSTAIYNTANVSIPFQRNADNISFVVSINAFSVTYFTVYIDDDSNFTGASSSISGSDTLNELVMAPEKLEVLQYSKIQRLNQSVYSFVKNSTKMRGDFSIRITDAVTNNAFIDYGGTIPRSGTVISLDKFVLFQNSTGGIRKGKLLVRTW